MAKIEIDLSELGFQGFDEDGEPIGGSSLTDLIVQGAIDRLMRNQRKLTDEIKERINQDITAEVDLNVKKLVQEAFDAPVQRTTSWGETQGEPTTVRELIRKSIESYVTAPNSTRGYGDKPKNLIELIDDSTKKLLDKDFNEYLKQVKEGVKATVHQKALSAAVEYLQK